MILIKPVLVSLLIVSFCAAVSVSTTRAETTPQSSCSQAFDQCLNKCDLDFHDAPAKRAACVPVCSGKFAACDAGVAYDKAKPWLEDQAKKTKNFFEGLIEQYGKTDPAEAPDKKTKDNSI